jgi:poly [ADP-ribose] polymerase
MSKIQVFPVDHLCPTKTFQVYIKNGVVYSCTLNQTDIVANKNKFYIMQILCNKDQTIFDLYIRYGRISENGKIINKKHATMQNAISDFAKQFKAKTGNVFGNNFVKKDGKYFMTEVQYEIEAKEIKKEIKKEDKKEKVVSKLNERQNFLMELFTNKKTMENTLVSLSIDPKKMPLGKISKSQLDEATNILAKIRHVLESEDSEDLNNSDSKSESKNSTLFTKLSSEFYTLVPYSCGRNRPPIIDNEDTLGKFVEMVDELKNLEVAINVSKQVGENLDGVYDSLNAKMVPLEKDCQMWKVISDYVINTHGATHKTQVKLVDIYDLSRNESQNVAKTIKKIGNKQLLFHGSRMSNFCSIIKNGLILNPESLGAFVTGRMFSNGIYTANSFSKSFNYCASDTSDGYACLLLCEVALGTQLKKTQADPYLCPEKLKKEKCHSTWGQGQNTPSSSTIVDGVSIPNGKLEKSGVSSCLLYDEYIVYDTNQISLKYLIVVKA